jgi:hypothetical protein
LSKERIEAEFSHIVDSGYSISSPASSEYNCIAWAAEDTEKLWWPDNLNIGYWPLEIPREETVDAFVRAFEMLGYRCCENAFREESYEKIAIYVDSRNKPTHMARQLNSGRWTSKLGRLEDVEHDLDAFIDSDYGDVSVIMKRIKVN